MDDIVLKDGLLDQIALIVRAEAGKAATIEGRCHIEADRTNGAHIAHADPGPDQGVPREVRRFALEHGAGIGKDSKLNIFPHHDPAF